jgi:hypothetical protein
VLGIGTQWERELVGRLIAKYGVTKRRHLHLAAREFLVAA